MRNIFQNKKVLISIIVAVVVIVVAIVLFVVLGKGADDKKSDGNSTIKFSDDKNKGNSTDKVLDNKKDNQTSNKTENKTDNRTANAITNNNSPEVVIGSDVEDFHKNAAEQFLKAFMDTDEMQEFLDNYVDMKAFVAYENIDGDDAKFMEEYVSLSDDDPKIEEAKQACLGIPASYSMVLTFMDAMMQMAKQSGEMGSQSEGWVTESGEDVDWDSFTDEDKKLALKEISNPEKSDGDEHITKIKVTYTLMQEDGDLYIVFYDDIVIFVCDEEGKALTASGTDFSGFDNEM